MEIIEHLKSKGVEPSLLSVISAICVACKEISLMIQSKNIGGKAGTQNVFGEEQLALDVASDKLISETLRSTPEVGLYASEELEKEMPANPAGVFGVAYDPLDGSSLVDVNFAVGSIFGIYKTKTFISCRGSEQACAMVAVYGPRTTIVCGANGAVHEYTLSDGKFILSKENLKIEKEGKIFAPGNLRACLYHPGYKNLLNYWLDKQYTLRYSGGMVPDINHILLKGKGLFTYPGYKDMPDGKLRLLYECAPMSFLVETAGGRSTDGKMRLLDKEIKELAQRTPILIGSEEEVKQAETMLA